MTDLHIGRLDASMAHVRHVIEGAWILFEFFENVCMKQERGPSNDLG
jgi:hypothetical protein